MLNYELVELRLWERFHRTEQSFQDSPKTKHRRVNQLQWQEGTDEPEDEPNISNGEDVEPKRTPTRQPYEMT